MVFIVVIRTEWHIFGKIETSPSTLRMILPRALLAPRDSLRRRVLSSDIVPRKDEAQTSLDIDGISGFRCCSALSLPTTLTFEIRPTNLGVVYLGVICCCDKLLTVILCGCGIAKNYDFVRTWKYTNTPFLVLLLFALRTHHVCTPFLTCPGSDFLGGHGHIS